MVPVTPPSQQLDGPGHRLRAIYKQAGILQDELDDDDRDLRNLAAIRRDVLRIAERHDLADIDAGGGEA